MSGSVRSESPALDTDTTRPGAGGLRRAGVPLVAAAVFLAAHLPFLPHTLEDIDSVNFALGLRDFDPLQHRPHPPGYPVYIAGAKTSRAVIDAVSDAPPQALDALALSSWSAIGGAAAILLCAAIVRTVGLMAGVRDAAAAAAPAAVVLACAPLFWMAALRPLSDMPGLAVALGAQLALLRAALGGGSRRRSLALLAAGSLAAGLAVGVRSQALWLVTPVLVAAVLRQRGRGLGAGAAIALACAAAGSLIWAVPLILESGGVESYLAALERTADADFRNVGMLWSQPTPRRLALALEYTFVVPWGHPALAAVVLAAAAFGAALLAWGEPRAAGWLSLLFAPYLAFHLLFQDTPFSRYALPVLVPVAWSAAWLLARVARRLLWPAAGAVSTAGLAVLAPVAAAYGAGPLPPAEIVQRAVEAQARGGGVVGGHFEFARLLAVASVAPDRVLGSPEFDERLELVRYWLEGGRGPVWFVASPARTDIVGIDPYARHPVAEARWPFDASTFLGGIRPVLAQLLRIDSPPGWVAGEGWHLSREQIIVSERRGARTAELYFARDPGPSLMFIGGTYAPGPSGAAAVVRLTLDGRPLASWEVPAAQPQFFRSIHVDAGLRSGAGPMGRLLVEWEAGDNAPAARLLLTHFDWQPLSRPFWVFSHGWHDREFDPQRNREWRWASGRAEIRVHPAGRDVEIRLAGEAPVGSLGGPPEVRIAVGERVLRSFRPSGAFRERVRVPGDALQSAEGLVTISSDRTFVPGGADRRELALQIFELRVDRVTGRLTAQKSGR